jgi:hypothetical protein
MTCALAGSDHLQRCAAALGGPTIVRKGAVDGICDGEAALECGAAGSKRRAGGQARPLGVFWPGVSLCAHMRPLDTGHVVCQLHNLEVHSLPRTAKRRRVEAIWSVSRLFQYLRLSGIADAQGDVMSGCVAAFLSWAVNYGKQTGATQARRPPSPDPPTSAP